MDEKTRKKITKSIEDLIDFNEKTKEKTLRRELKVPVPTKEQIMDPPKTKSRWVYIIPSFNIIFILIVDILIFVFKFLNLFTILFVVLSIPILLGSIMTLVGKLYLDRKKIKQKTLPKVNKNFLVANFLSSNMRIYKEYVSINSDGITFDLGNRTYIIDKETIWRDDKNHPNSFYIPELPNPLKFDFEKYIKTYLRAMYSGNPEKAVDSGNNIIDVSYSSTNLQTYKKDKIFAEFHKDPDHNKQITFAFMVIGIMALFMFILALVKR